ncbi:hypothetical protein [Neorhizobium petrolearium]|uniref:Uncharacterized protein n=1 Tax=Neorhizobium petrolearium TaxID=515361 RepID=A0ABY8M256_9HYPH|nr:hypothetical protein [Neorhizobium petrolearium]MCC2608362.1 hypothetical protein [Neorhizobium petrolearium]WGI68641.1 hypothetical protein QEO92_00640 [Neorhizobium petrolearium]
MNARAVTIQPFATAGRSERHADPDLLDILATVHFWRLRAVEFTLLSLIVFWLCFAIACRL